ncbi:hypothetical protein ENBRE01_0147 [Enteropsectra breve]|nr:hypothetical protein ENBRE01_0147 [Enteropsectra breve]
MRFVQILSALSFTVAGQMPEGQFILLKSNLDQIITQKPDIMKSLQAFSKETSYKKLKCAFDEVTKINEELKKIEDTADMAFQEKMPLMRSSIKQYLNMITELIHELKKEENPLERQITGTIDILN